MVKIGEGLSAVWRRLAVWLVVAAVCLAPVGTAYANLAEADASEVSQRIVSVIADIVTPIGALVIFCVIAYTAFQLVVSANNPTKRTEVISSIPYILGGGIALGGIMLFAGFIIGIMNRVSG